MKNRKRYNLYFIRVFIICNFTFLSQLISAQKELTFFFNELQLSINLTDVADSNTENKIGWGASLYRNQKSENNFHFLFGLEYNLTNQKKKELYESYYAHSTDARISIQSISLPSGIRMDLLKSKSVFIQLLGFIDLTTGARKSGMMHTYLPDQNNTIVYKDFSYEEPMNIATLNLGIMPGAGFSFPIMKNKSDGFVKLEYKWGIKSLSYNYENIFNKAFRISLGIHL